MTENPWLRALVAADPQATPSAPECPSAPLCCLFTMSPCCLTTEALACGFLFVLMAWHAACVHRMLTGNRVLVCEWDTHDYVTVGDFLFLWL